MDVLMKINEAYCDKEHRPYKDIRYTSPEIIGPAVILFGILGSYLFLNVWENILLKLGK